MQESITTWIVLTGMIAIFTCCVYSHVVAEHNRKYRRGR